MCEIENTRNYAKLGKKSPIADAAKFDEANDLFVTQGLAENEKYTRVIGDDYKTEPRRFWLFVNDKRKSNNLPCKLNYNSKSATADVDKTNLLADFFSSVYTAYPSDSDYPN